MSKELSRQLCELCGIEPKIKYFLKFMDVEYESTKENIIAHAETFKTGMLKVTRVVKKYPDFTKPENFVGLLEILSDYMYDDDKGISFTKNYVVLGNPICLVTDDSEAGLNIREKVLKLLIDGLNESFESDKKLKQSIREAEWVYEA